MATRVLAVDLGASSARVCEVDLDAPAPRPRVLRRVEHAPRRDAGGTLRWDWQALLAAVKDGLRAGLAAGPVASIGVDTWGVDYGLLGAGGALLSPPVSYRDERTASWEQTAQRLGRDALYQTTGIQLMRYNTVFQLAVHDRAELGAAERLLMLPELVVWHLTGVAAGEVTSAGTSALVDVATGTWSPKLLDAIGVDPALMPEIMPAGTPAGSWNGVPVHLVGGHDTASAVAAVSGLNEEGAAFVASGTWFLVGAWRAEPDTGAAAQEANFTNEPAVGGGVRFLKNVTGLWLLEQCRSARPGWPAAAEAAQAAEKVPPGPLVDPEDPALHDAGDMAGAICRAAGLGEDAPPEVVVRCILDSVAAATARTLRKLGELTGQPVRTVHLIGGGVHIPLLRRLVAEASGATVVPGHAEATAQGNALVQGVAIGRFPDLAAAQEHLARAQ